MARILTIGNATVDIINRVSTYPREDQELRALSQQQRSGGNATNTAIVLSQLGHRVNWAGTLSDQPTCRPILDTFERHAIDYSGAEVVIGGAVPTSYITLSEATGSRTIVHHRDLDEFPFERFRTLPLDSIDWLHFEGRNLTGLARMIDHICQHHPQLRYSIEVEKPRPAIETLFHGATLLLFSRDYAENRGYISATALLGDLTVELTGQRLVCSWGDEGAAMTDGTEGIITLPAYRPERVIDTVGAGDTFNAGMIDGLCRGLSGERLLAAAIELAGRKCGVDGLEAIAR